MDYDKIIIDLLNQIVTLEEKVKNIGQSTVGTDNNNAGLSNGSKKYRFLSDYLRKSNAPRIQLSFQELEDILKFKLPDSAKIHRTFWANTESHSIALSWMCVNYLVAEVNLNNQYIVFEKARSFETMKRNSTVTTEENYLLSCKNHNMLELYKKLRATMFEYFDEVSTGATSYYAHWDICGKRQRQFAILYIQKEKIRIETLIPSFKNDSGEILPDSFSYTLNYKTEITKEADIKKVKDIILDSYKQIKMVV